MGAYFALRVTDWPAFNVTGNVTPDTLKPAPATLAPLIVKGLVPDDVRVTFCDAAEPTATFPKDRLEAPSVNLALATGFR